MATDGTDLEQGFDTQTAGAGDDDIEQKDRETPSVRSRAPAVHTVAHKDSEETLNYDPLVDPREPDHPLERHF
ncbi:hypothetical protein HK104_007426, partial [Borealophlyctis nickersoniae]